MLDVALPPTAPDCKLQLCLMQIEFSYSRENGRESVFIDIESENSDYRSINRQKRQQQVDMQEPKPKKPRTLGFCRTCGVTESLQWRSGPQGSNTLCNSCGIKWRKGTLKGASGNRMPISGVDGTTDPSEMLQPAVMPKQPRKPRPMMDGLCESCSATKSLQWRAGPKGSNTLCNSCGIKWRKGRIVVDGKTFDGGPLKYLRKRREHATKISSDSKVLPVSDSKVLPVGIALLVL